ncbi:hypothetical protein [Dokdonia donghaensis]|nr:hypothetical protein [Dokdonia donghaensis]ANH60762.1 hypothetical protein I597_1860 [Dokdonia donghaensis DSW-1]
MGLTVINNSNTLRVVQNARNTQASNTLSVVHRKVDKPVIQLMTY